MDERNEIPENAVVGRNAVSELLKSGRAVDKIFVKDGAWEGSIKEIAAMARERKIPIVSCGKSKLDKLAPGMAHQGIIAFAPEKEYCSVDDIIEYARSKNEEPFILIADGINDPHNLGALIRCAEAAGCHGLIIPKRRSVTLTATVSKASAGAIEHMRVAKVTNLAQTIDELKERGLWLYAADMDGESYYDSDLSGAVGLVMGSEGFGISRLVKEKCDFVLSIPLYGSVNSMNVSCAAAVLMTEVARQKNRK